MCLLQSHCQKSMFCSTNFQICLWESQLTTNMASFSRLLNGNSGQLLRVTTPLLYIHFLKDFTFNYLGRLFDNLYGSCNNGLDKTHHLPYLCNTDIGCVYYNFKRGKSESQNQQVAYCDVLEYLFIQLHMYAASYRKSRVWMPMKIHFLLMRPFRLS